jgi:hypothetical protein
MSFFDTIAMLASSAGYGSKQNGEQAQINQELINQRIRNQARIEQIKIEMGEKYILHPSHNKTRLDTPRPV